ncbi:hypothetical protein SEA_BECKERTON_2 [Mycobacterium phage Beckerton]|nr:hypothetical protein SEA_BECKERTON_2 [Mycobacterium phage Beckerton]
MGSRTLSTYLQEDLDQIAALPDGEDVWVDLIGFEVPSFIDPRYDLILPGQVQRATRLQHHVPFAMRGPFRPSDLPDGIVWEGETNEEGYCVCRGRRKDGLPCRSGAINRSEFCGTHGGQLHPADKKMTKLADGLLPDVVQARKLKRSDKVMMGIIPIEELGDDEIQGLFVYEDDGKKVKSRKLTEKIHQGMVREMMTRAQDYMQTSLPSMLKVVKDIAEDPLNEAGDRFKAAVWMAERSIGKTPDVIIHGKTDAPYEQIFTRLETTSRDDYRRAVDAPAVIEGEVVPDRDSGPDPDLRSRDDWADGPDHSHREDPSGDSGINLGGTRIVQSSDSVDEGEDGESPALKRARDIEERKKQLAAVRARREEMQKAKNRRYAARANGLTTTSDLPWLIEWKSTGVRGNFHAKLWPPDAVTPEIADRIATADALDTAPAVDA